jgi:hypothetical protein
MAEQMKNAEQQNPSVGNTLSNSRQSDRRSLMKAGAALGASLIVAPAFQRVNGRYSLFAVEGF